jgi:peptidoglycan/LPS O-acetylase OafA/YrhL
MKKPEAITAGKFDALTSLRFLAALVVVLFHTGQTSLRFMPLWVRGMMKNGVEVVSLFFVLSGFVLAYSYGAAPSRSVRGGSKPFWRKRFARIYPIYAVAILVALPICFSHLNRGLLRPGDAFTAVIVTPLLLQSWFLSPAISGAIDLPAWSLSVEAFFYAAFPLLLGLTMAIGPVLAISLAYVCLVCSEVFLSYPVFQYFPPYHLATFLIGVGCGVWFRRSPRRPMRTLACCAAFLLGVVLGFRDLLPAFLHGRSVIVPLFAALIVSVASCAGRLRILECRLLVLLGDASYS